MDDTSLRDMRAEAARLDAEVQDALELGQYEKAALLSAEKDAIEEGIAKATGLRGRNRRHTDECERARKAVAVGLKRALRHIGEKAPKIASHLENSIQAVRGTGWVYRPGGGEVIRVERRS
jgi:pyruvate/2-oxoacid:ferredoxin oxidoreductase beta subunit